MVAPVVVSANHLTCTTSDDIADPVLVPSPTQIPTMTVTTSKQSNSSNNSNSFSNATNSINSKTASSSTTRSSHLLSHSLHDNMLQKHHKDDPMQFYTIEAVLGEGSMVRWTVSLECQFGRLLQCGYRQILRHDL